MKNKKTTAFKIIWTVFFLLLSVIFFMPLLWMLSSSLKTSPQVFEIPFRWFTDRLHWENYKEIWTSVEFPFLRLYKNSIFISVISVAGQIIISSMAAYAFAIVDFKGRNVLFILFLITMMIPAQVLLIPRYVLFRSIGIYNTLWSIILPHFFNISSIFLFRQFYLTFPKELLEAAKIDGCSYYSIFFRIILPLTTPALITSTIFSFMWRWDDFLSALLYINESAKYPVSLALKLFCDPGSSSDYGAMFAMATISILPAVIMFICLQKYLVEGISTSGLKG